MSKIEARKKLIVAVGTLIAMIFAMAGIGQQGVVDGSPATRLVLTQEGCKFAQSIAIKTDQTGGLCAITARYNQPVFGKDGMLYLADGREISITSSMILAHSPSMAILPLTKNQESAQMWCWTWFTIAGVLVIASLIFASAIQEKSE